MAPYNRQDRTGQKHGRFTLLASSEHQSKQGQYYWHARCECGTEKEVLPSDLIHGATRSCGCWQREVAKEVVARNGTKLPPGEAAFNRIVKQYRNNARAKNREWSLTKDECRAMLTGNCEYCGITPHRVMASNVKASSDNGVFTYNGIDRVDSELGYTPENTCSCCFECNRAKSNLTKQVFLEWAQRVAQHQTQEMV